MLKEIRREWQGNADLHCSKMLNLGFYRISEAIKGPLIEISLLSHFFITRLTGIFESDWSVAAFSSQIISNIIHDNVISLLIWVSETGGIKLWTHTLL